MHYRQWLPVALTPATGVLLWPWRTADVEMQWWAVDPLVKVLDGDQPGRRAEQTIRISAARGQAEAGQVAFRSDRPVAALTISAGPLRQAQGGHTLADVRVALLNYHLLRSATAPVVAKELCAQPPVPPSTDGWRRVFSDDFERAELGPHWTPEKHTEWAIRQGRLTLVKSDGAVLLARPLRHAQRIEFDGWAETDHPCDLSGIFCADPKKRAAFESGYFFGFGTEMNAFSKLLINFVEYVVLPTRITPGKRHHVVCQRDGDRLALWVDGQSVFHCLHRDRLDGPQETRAGVYTYNRNQFFDNVRIYEK